MLSNPGLRRISVNGAESPHAFEPVFVPQRFRKAAADGHIEAQFCLACCYSEGLGVRKSPTMKVRWLKRAAQAGHETAAGPRGHTPSLIS